ncbi:unnamed protein product [Bemisia tabaci]|uniref:Uncharacterized protein n=1 Tax=Bemisia tabaci TaxID=7038 RepID=A0A9P0F9F2_BEMTA|nr:unnamed protein product [Bemisia tabaci]
MAGEHQNSQSVPRHLSRGVNFILSSRLSVFIESSFGTRPDKILVQSCCSLNRGVANFSTTILIGGILMTNPRLIVRTLLDNGNNSRLEDATIRAQGMSVLHTLKIEGVPAPRDSDNDDDTEDLSEDPRTEAPENEESSKSSVWHRRTGTRTLNAQTAYQRYMDSALECKLPKNQSKNLDCRIL